ncbi:ABC transporter substrate-binding protein [Microbacterium azadirachtae]|uniref:Carbohydrate ABC transporter substrate-binding protein, CUT1 family n=1 Tax=Microbacterium azadirachtae TaxID=582680 RepID=A0A1I6HBG6_9MICO|nr:sugar ABC transporter substrate-binding protein [Microbacterium azadirachtae]SFR51856.1 carbohydrate ABC transporter substrate-binding protein, CUT1 family [Microbacterium azadirachtae]
MKKNIWMRAAVVVGAASLMMGALAGCQGGSDAAQGGSKADIDAALKKGGELTWWTWSDATQKQADAFTKEHPNVKIKVVKLDNPDAAVTKLQNAVKAGSGAPDIVPVEYQTMPQLTMAGALADMTSYGFDGYKDQFTASTWSSVNVNGKLVGIPMDSGPMVFIYNKDLYAAAGITEAPKTWDEFVKDSAAIHAKDPNTYIATGGDAGFFTSMIWASGGHPFKTDGEKVTIDLQDEGSKKFADMWGGMLQRGELSPLATWSDEWSKALNQDKLATLMMGSWMISGMDDHGAGKWQVAPMPTWDGTPGSAENGGSGLSVTDQSKNKALAAAVLQFMADGTGRTLINQNGFPSTVKEFDNADWKSMTFAAYGDQKPNPIGADSAKSVIAGWQYLPFQGYANNVFGDSVGKAIGAKGDLNAALKEWQKTLVDYGNQQGFQVNK